jgi:hypothetical protein
MSPALVLKGGVRVKLQGLVKTPEHNDKCGVVIHEEGERWLVRLDGGKELKLKPANLVADPDAENRAPKTKKVEGSPEKKRARFGDDGGDVQVTVHEVGSQDEDGESSDEESEDPPFSTWANKVLTLKMLSSDGDSETETAFNPLFTHQVFYAPPAVKDGERMHEELLIGYESPEVEVVYAANTLRAWLDFRHKGTVPQKQLTQAGLFGRTNVLTSLEVRPARTAPRRDGAPCPAALPLTRACAQERVKSDYVPRRADVEADARGEFTPFGTRVSCDPAGDGAGGSDHTLEVFHSCPTSPAEVAYVRRMQTLVTWMIETGSAIEVPSPPPPSCCCPLRG